MTGLIAWRIVGVVVLCAVSVNAAPAQTFITLVNLDRSNGTAPKGTLVQGVDGNLYGTTDGGGANLEGTVFKITPDGTLSTLYSFCAQTNCTDGYSPLAGLVQAIDGNFYGTTSFGGSSGNCPGSCGTVFKITPTGTLTTVHSFNSTDGAKPYSGLVQASNGNFYGTTSGESTSLGTVFKVTSGGTLTTLHVFAGTDGEGPLAGLVQGVDGNLYGTTSSGTNCGGTIFKITLGGTLTTLYCFNGLLDGANPFAGLVQALDGNFYGTTYNGGSSGNCEVGCGTVFKITPEGKLTTLHSFGSEDGANPSAGLVQATDGSLYGTTDSGDGTVFKITPGGTLTTLHSFDGTDGADPRAGLVQATNGTLYGTTAGGGANESGTVFSLSVGLRPFVSLVRNPAKVGQIFGILGQGLAGTGSVSLNGTPATFTIKSDTFLTGTVPAGGTTGFVTVTTPNGTLTSNVAFRVTPQLLSFSPPSGPVGTLVTITGVSLSQTSGVGFGDYVPASFTVNSDTQVTATAPSRARTGKVGIQTPGGTAISSASFTVTP